MYSDAGLIGALVVAEAASAGQLQDARKSLHNRWVKILTVSRQGGGRGGVRAAGGECDGRAGGRGQEAAAGRRVHPHGGPAADGREDGQWELLQ